MSDITELVLCKYYGFGGDPNNTKFLSSHEATFDPKKFYNKSDSTETSIVETIKESAIGGTSLEVVNDEMENLNPRDSIGNAIVRSSRVISDEDILDDEDDGDIEEYVELVESTKTKANKEPAEDDKKIFDAEKPLTPKREMDSVNDPVVLTEPQLMGHFDDTTLSNTSDTSSIPTKQKPNRRMSVSNTTSTLSSQSLQPPRKLPACNGVFLDLTNLSLIEFPTNILTNMPNLRMLYLENNCLTKLPEQLFTILRLLQWLDVRSNQLKSLPKTMAHHPNLETILLDGNLFEELPLELCLLPNLKGLQTSRNPLNFPPPDILALGFAVTINFLRSEWNKRHPEEIVESPKNERKPKPSTILTLDKPILQRTLRSSRILGSSSTGQVADGKKKSSVRQKGRSYRPSNRCKSVIDEDLELRLLWIAKVKEMLTEQAIALQKIKNRDALSDWRRDRRSYDKSMSKARNRSEEDVPYAIDFENYGFLENRLKMPIGISKSRKRETTSKNINEKITELYESLNRLHKARESDALSPRMERKLLENEIKKLSDVQEEIQNLRRCNETTTVPFEGSELLPKIAPYEPTPSIII